MRPERLIGSSGIRTRVGSNCGSEWASNIAAPRPARYCGARANFFDLRRCCAAAPSKISRPRRLWRGRVTADFKPFVALGPAWNRRARLLVRRESYLQSIATEPHGD